MELDELNDDYALLRKVKKGKMSEVCGSCALSRLRTSLFLGSRAAKQLPSSPTACCCCCASATVYAETPAVVFRCAFLGRYMQREFDIATGLEEDSDAEDNAPNGGRHLSLQAQGVDTKRRSKKKQKKSSGRGTS